MACFTRGVRDGRWTSSDNARQQHFWSWHYCVHLVTFGRAVLRRIVFSPLPKCFKFCGKNIQYWRKWRQCVSLVELVWENEKLTLLWNSQSSRAWKKCFWSSFYIHKRASTFMKNHNYKCFKKSEFLVATLFSCHPT